MFESPLYNLNPHLFILKSMKNSTWFVSLSTYGYGATHEEGVKEHDIHIKLKSYKLEILRELVV